MTTHTPLPHYTRIHTGTDHAAYLTSQKTHIDYTDAMTTTDLWRHHDHPTPPPPSKAGRSLLDLKVTIADRLTSSCILCERRCHTNRHTTTGACNTQEPRVACEFLHTGEERPLIPSHTIFFSGCTLHCAFCQNADISQARTGDVLSSAQLAERILLRANQGAKNVNWVGGDPTANLPYILTVLQELSLNIPQIWNSNMYCSQETMRLLSGVIDLYLTDFKFGNDACARRLASADNYLTVVQRNHLHAAQDGDVLVRHLMLPGHWDCCTKPILEWLAANIPDATVNIMAQYHPEYHAEEFLELRRPITTTEYRTAVDYAETIGLRLL